MFTKKFARNCAVLVLSAFGVLGLASCNNANNGDNGGNTPDIQTPETTYTVKFMIQDANNAWTVLIDKKATDGKVELPTAPAKKYYTFAGWYTTEALTEEFNENSVKANANAYAKYIPQEVKVHINDEPVETKNLVDVVNAVYNPGEGLEFDGWYKDANYSVQWNGTDIVKDLYAKSVALITFNNGYEDVYTMSVKPGTVVENPAETEVDGTEEGTKTTLEAKEIVESYMDVKDISYVDDEGKDFDFTKPILKSTTITVNWATKGLNYTKSKTSDGYYVRSTSMNPDVAKAPVLSIPGKATIEVEEKQGDETVKVEKLVDVEGFQAYTSVSNIIPVTAKKVIFGEGIKFIKGFNGPVGNVIEEIELPTTLKILDNSFTNMPNLKGINLPEGLEIFIGSMFNNVEDPTDEIYRKVIRGENYAFDIDIPSTVKNIAMCPTNLKFAEGSKFVKDGDIIYLNSERGKILIADNANLKNKTIIVPEGFTGIQVGTYIDCKFDYLVLPESLEFVNYNEKWIDYKYYQHMEDYDNHLFANRTTPDGKFDTEALAPAAYAFANYANGFYMMHPAAPIVLDHDGAGFVVYKTASKPATLNDYAIVGCVTGYEPWNGKYNPVTHEKLVSKLVFADDNENLYFALERFKNEELSAQLEIDTFDNATCVIPTKEGITIEEITTALKEQNTDKAEIITAALAGKTMKFFANNKEIALKDIKGEMFISISLVAE